MNLKANVVTFALTIIFSFPAFADKAKILRDLEMLHPQLSKEEIQKKIDLANDAGEFLRSFPTYFFYTLKSNSQLIASLIKLAPEAGWCVGDAHFANFGAVLDKRGKALLTINDLDDGGPCPLMTDTLKYFTSLLLDGYQFNWALVMFAYRQGLESGPNLPSRETQTLLALSEKRGLGVDPDDLETPSKLKREKDSRETTASEKEFITRSIASSYSSAWNMIDSYAYTKQGGGSHGLLRFRALIKNGGAFQQIQFKQLVQPAIFPLVVGAMPSAAIRIKTSLLVEQGDNYSPFYSIQNLSSTMPMFMQPLRFGDVKYKVKDYNSGQIQNIIVDQTKQLARIHSKTASQKYPQAIASTVDMEWTIATRNLAKYFREVYTTLKQ